MVQVLVGLQGGMSSGQLENTDEELMRKIRVTCIDC